MRPRSSTPAQLDAGALTKALLFGEEGRSRDVTPGGSPSRKRQRVYGDRYVATTSIQRELRSFELEIDGEGPSAQPSTRSNLIIRTLRKEPKSANIFLQFYPKQRRAGSASIFQPAA
jgi:hypothetical protein